MNLFNQQSFCENTPKLDNNEIIFIAHKLNPIFAYPPSTPYYTSAFVPCNLWGGISTSPGVGGGGKINLGKERVLFEWWFYFYANCAAHTLKLAFTRVVHNTESVIQSQSVLAVVIAFFGDPFSDRTHNASGR